MHRIGISVKLCICRWFHVVLLHTNGNQTHTRKRTRELQRIIICLKYSFCFVFVSFLWCRHRWNVCDKCHPKTVATHRLRLLFCFGLLMPLFSFSSYTDIFFILLLTRARALLITATYYSFLLFSSPLFCISFSFWRCAKAALFSLSFSRFFFPLHIPHSMLPLVWCSAAVVSIFVCVLSILT